MCSVLICKNDLVHFGRNPAPPHLGLVVPTILATMQQERFDGERREQLAEMSFEPDGGPKRRRRGETRAGDRHGGTRPLGIQDPVGLAA